MLKPPNVQPIYPIRDENVKTRSTINLTGKALKRKGPIIIFNAEISDTRSILSMRGHKYFYTIMDSLRNLTHQMDDFDIIIIYDNRKSYEVNLAMKKLNISNIMGLETTDPFNI